MNDKVIGGSNNAGECGNKLCFHGSRDAVKNLDVEWLVNGKSSNPLNNKDIYTLKNTTEDSAKGKLEVKVNGEMHTVVEDLSKYKDYIKRPEDIKAYLGAFTPSNPPPVLTPGVQDTNSSGFSKHEIDQMTHYPKGYNRDNIQNYPKKKESVQIVHHETKLKPGVYTLEGMNDFDLKLFATEFANTFKGMAGTTAAYGADKVGLPVLEEIGKALGKGKVNRQAIYTAFSQLIGGTQTIEVTVSKTGINLAVWIPRKNILGYINHAYIQKTAQKVGTANLFGRVKPGAGNIAIDLVIIATVEIGKWLTTDEPFKNNEKLYKSLFKAIAIGLPAGLLLAPAVVVGIQLLAAKYSFLIFFGAGIGLAIGTAIAVSMIVSVILGLPIANKAVDGLWDAVAGFDDWLLKQWVEFKRQLEWRVRMGLSI